MAPTGTEKRGKTPLFPVFYFAYLYIYIYIFSRPERTAPDAPWDYKGIWFTRHSTLVRPPRAGYSTTEILSMARSVLGFFLFYGRMGCPDFDGPELLHVACSIAKCLTKIWGDGFRNFLNGWAIFRKTTFSHNATGKIYNDTVQWELELHVRACLRTFEKFLSSDTFLLICPSLFTSLKEIFCCCSLILTRRITRPACLHVFTPTRDAERGCREQRILVVRYKITESKQIVWKETGVFRTMLPIFFAPGETFGSVELRRHGSRPSTVGFVLVLRRTIKSSDRDELLSLHPKEENSQFSWIFRGTFLNVSFVTFFFDAIRAVVGQSISSFLYFFNLANRSNRISVFDNWK